MAIMTPRLELQFQGWFMCRIATDPDPTHEKRGMSGYTMALAGEDPLDQVIRLQEDDYVRRNLREPARQVLRPPLVPPDVPPGHEPPAIGVFVTGVTLNGEDYRRAQELLGARVHLLGGQRVMPTGQDVFRGPIFESRNNIVGSDDTMSFVINPFHLRIERSDAGRELLMLDAEDYVNPADPKQEPWQIPDPASYARRLSLPPQQVQSNSPEVLETTGVFDFYAYFRDRRRYLEGEIRDATRYLEETPGLPPSVREVYELRLQRARSRIFQIERWGDRVSSKLGMQVGWSFDINGPKQARGTGLPGGVDLRQHWPVRLWFGGWDGDLLTGYMRGSLTLPLLPEASAE
jgi:hypothetical protein